MYCHVLQGKRPGISEIVFFNGFLKEEHMEEKIQIEWRLMNLKTFFTTFFFFFKIM